MRLEWIICTMEWIIFKSSGSRWSLNCNILRKNNLSLSFRIIYLVLNIVFQVYHVSTTNIDLAVLIFVARFNVFISLGNDHEFVNASISVHKVRDHLTINNFKNPFGITSLWIDFNNSLIPWVHMCIINNIIIQ